MAKNYIKSNNIQVFPCAYRGQSENSIIDPEARLHTEKNLTHAATSLKNTYIINYETNDYIEFVIHGYYFKISNLSEYTDFLVNTYACIKFKDDIQINGTYKTSLLASWAESNDTFYLDNEDGKFTGLTFVTAEDTTELAAAGENKMILFTENKGTSGGLIPNYTEFLPHIEGGSSADKTAVVIGANIISNDKLTDINNPGDNGRNKTKATGSTAIAEGASTIAEGYAAHSEGELTYAKGEGSRAEGAVTQAIGNYSHAEGYKTTASGESSHAEGNETVASGKYSHAAGDHTKADKDNLTAVGKYNTTEDKDLFVVGNGSSTTSSNVLQVNEEKVVINKDTRINKALNIYPAETGTKVGFTILKNDEESESVIADNNGALRSTDVLTCGNGDDNNYFKTNSTETVIGSTKSGDTITNKFKVDNATGNTEIAGTIQVGGTATIGGDTTISGTTTISGNATISGTTELQNSLTIKTKIGTEEEATEKASILSDGTIKATKQVIVGDEKVGLYNNGNVVATGNIIGQNNLFIKKDTTTEFSVDNDGNTVISGTLKQGNASNVDGTDAHAEGNQTIATGSYSHAEGYGVIASGDNSHAEGDHTIAGGVDSHAEGYGTTANTNYAHAEGAVTTANGIGTHAEGHTTYADGEYSHTEGYYTTANGEFSHAEGKGNSGRTTGLASGKYSHVEGEENIASGEGSHAEGFYTVASGNYAHAEGHHTEATNDYAHAEGFYTKTGCAGQKVIGQYNVGKTTTIFEIGNGTGTDARTNIFEVENNKIKLNKTVDCPDCYLNIAVGITAISDTDYQRLLPNLYHSYLIYDGRRLDFKIKFDGDTTDTKKYLYYSTVVSGTELGIIIDQNVTTNAHAISLYKFEGGTFLAQCEQFYDYNRLITKIDRGIFTYKYALKDVYLPNCSQINESGFYACTKLTNISVPQVTTIGTNAFYNCNNLSSISLPACNIIHGNAFNDCDNLSAAYIGGNDTIASYAFMNCINLITVSAPNIDTVGDCAFSDCAALSNVTLTNCNTISKYAFYGCKNLSNLELPNCTTILTSTNFTTFYGTALVSISWPKLSTVASNLFRYHSNLTTVNLQQCTTIKDNAFCSCQNLNKVIVPSCTSIGEYAFQQCSNLTTVYLASGATIQGRAFSECTNLSYITNLSQVSAIHNYAFYSCDSLFTQTYHNLPLYNCSYLASYAFAGVSLYNNSISIAVGPKLTHFEWNGVYNTTSYNGGLYIYGSPTPYSITGGTSYYLLASYGSSTVTSIGLNISCKTIGCSVFAKYTSLSSITYLSRVTTICDRAFSGCTKLNTLNLNACKYVGAYAFSACTSLTTLQYFNPSYIENYAFTDCESLININAANWTSIISIGEYAIPDTTTLSATDLTTISWNNCEYIGDDNSFISRIFPAIQSLILSKCSYIGYSTFSNCTNLANVTLKSTAVCTLVGNPATVFKNTKINGTDGFIYVPEDLLEDYKNEYITWSQYFKKIE